MNQEITKRNEMLTKLKLSFQHINDVLRHVGEKHTAVRQYDNNDLKLPLLKLGSFAPRNLPPTPVEENGWFGNTTAYNIFVHSHIKPLCSMLQLMSSGN